MKRLLTFVTAIILFAVSGMSQNNCDLINSATFNVPETTKTVLRSYVLRLENAFFDEVDVNQWNYIVWVKTGTNQGRIYKNGRLVASGNFQNVTYSYSRLDLGAEFFTSWDNFFNGLIDEVKISNNVRSENDILNYYNSNQPFSADANTVGLWRFDENTGTTVNGIVGPAGTITNGAWAPGRFGSCVSYNGQSSRTSINLNIPTSNMTVEFWIKPNGLPDRNIVSRPVSLYGFNTTTFVMQTRDARKKYIWSTGDTGTVVTVDPTKLDFLWASDGQCKDTIWFKTKSTCNSTTPSYIPQNGLIGWWPFNGNANDGSANNNNGTISGATLIADRFGNSNSAYYYDGINDYIEIPNISAYNNQLYTISYWTKFSTPSTPGSGGFDVNPALISKLSASTSVTYDNWVFYEANGTPGFAYGSAGYGSSNSLFNDNNWHNIICTVDSDSVRFYYDGVQTSAVLKGPNLTFNSQPIKIGRSIATYWKAFNGIIDDIAIYNRALSEQEIKNLYTGNICYQSVSVTDTLFINSTITSFNPITYENTIKIYPNPSQGQLTIDFGNINTLSGYQMKVINPIGQQIFQSNITQRISNIALSSLSAKGVYFVQLIDSKGEVRENRKIVIQ